MSQLVVKPGTMAKGTLVHLVGVWGIHLVHLLLVVLRNLVGVKSRSVVKLKLRMVVHVSLEVFIKYFVLFDILFHFHSSSREP